MKAPVEKVRAAIAADRDYQMSEGQGAANAGIAQGQAACLTIWLVLGLSTLICLTMGWALIRGICGPINKMSGVMRQLASGQLDADVPNRGDKTEIGDMAGAVQVFKDNLIRTRALEAEAAAAARIATEAQRKQIMADLADQFEHAVGSIVQTVSAAAVEMQATASQLTANANEASMQATSVSAAAEEAGTNVTSVASAAEELGASVGEIGRQVDHSYGKAQEAVVKADQTASIVYELSEAAGRINGIVKLISDIASPDQSAGAERHHRVGARRRGRPRLCRRCRGGQGAGQPDVQRRPPISTSRSMGSRKRLSARSRPLRPSPARIRDIIGLVLDHRRRRRNSRARRRTRSSTP